MSSDTPQILTSYYGSPSTGLQFGGVAGLVEQEEPVIWDAATQEKALRRRLTPAEAAELVNQELMANSNPRRIVQVFIADPNPDVPLEKALLYKGDTKFTDATDQELYFEVPINDLLKAHNEARVKWLDKEATRRSGRDVFLEAAKIRELKMCVVNVATF